MSSFELRVHISGPSMLRDDVRWTSIARGIARFKPITKTNVADSFLQSSPVEKDAHHTHECACRESALTISRHDRKATGNRECEPELPGQARGNLLKRSAAQIGDAIVPGEVKRAKRNIFARTEKGLNPTLSTPIQEYLKSGKEFKETPKTNAVPASKILVPFTSSPKARHTIWNTADGTIAEGHKVANANTSFGYLIRDTLFTDVSMIDTDSLEMRPFQSQPTSSCDGTKANKTSRDQGQVQEVVDDDQEGTDAGITTFRMSQPSLRESCTNIGTMKSVPRSLDKLANRSAEEACSLQPRESSGTTQTPSTSGHVSPQISPLTHKSKVVIPQVIDLTSGHETPTSKFSGRQLPGLTCSPDGSDAVLEHARALAVGPQQALEKLQGLPRRIESPIRPQPRFRGDLSDSFITPHLADLASEFDLLKVFRPIHGPTSLSNSQRGYWQLFLLITDLGTTARSRKAPLTASQWSDKRFMLRQEGQVAPDATTPDRDAILDRIVHPAKDPRQPTPWTLEEFWGFWQQLGKAVHLGVCGFYTRATIVSMHVLEDGVQISARIFCHGEILPHLWLVLLGLSRSLTCNMPLQWCVPGQGPVISMTGQPQSNLGGRWVEVQPGTCGYWSFECP